MRVLFASSEMFPVVKTGGLGDVTFSLPHAISDLGVDVRVALPAYRSVLEEVEGLRVAGWLPLASGEEVRILSARHSAIEVPLWLVDAPSLFDRVGQPYTDPHGHDWGDNARRFSVFSEACAMLADDRLGIDWRADVVHANDWQTGLLPAFCALLPTPPRTLFTVHNLAYDCQVDFRTFNELGLPTYWWSMEFGEFYGRLSMLKCGLVFSDLITTVSPRYAQEIRTSEFGYGYAPVLDRYADKLVGVLNGIDDKTWDPSRSALPCRRQDPQWQTRQSHRAAGGDGRVHRGAGHRRPADRLRRTTGLPEGHRPAARRYPEPACQQRRKVRVRG